MMRRYEAMRFNRIVNRMPIAAILCSTALVATAQAQEGIALPTGPVPIEDILSARPFVLDNGYRHTWQRESPLVTRGYVIALRADPALTLARATREPELYVGDQIVERLNAFDASGYVVGLVPGELDLREAPVWYGPPCLGGPPTREEIEARRVEALSSGLTPPGRQQVEAALAAGGEPIVAVNRGDLLDRIRPLLRGQRLD
jgi:hypothetical protein